MSRYLIDRIMATSNIELMTETEVVALDGPPGGSVEKVRCRNRPSGVETEAPVRRSSSSSARTLRPNGCEVAESRWTRRVS
jgi:hypothetical protein